MEQVDVADSKSVAFIGVWVRFPPPAPIYTKGGIFMKAIKRILMIVGVIAIVAGIATGFFGHAIAEAKKIWGYHDDDMILPMY